MNTHSGQDAERDHGPHGDLLARLVGGDDRDVGLGAAAGRRARPRPCGAATARRGRRGRWRGRRQRAAAGASAAASPPWPWRAWLRFSRCSGISVTAVNDRRRRPVSGKSAGTISRPARAVVHEFTTAVVPRSGVVDRRRDTRPRAGSSRRVLADELVSTPGCGGYSLCSSSRGRAAELLIAFETNVLKWPGMNVAFLFSFFLATGLALLVIPYAKRRPKGTPTIVGRGDARRPSSSSASCSSPSAWCPHQFIDHADKDLGWNKNNIIYGPGDILKPQALGGCFPFTMSYEAIRDIVVVVIHVWYFGLIIFLWSVWQKRGDGKPGTEVATSTFGRPLVKKG